MRINGTVIQDTHAEAFNAWAVRLIVTAQDPTWVDAAVQQVTGYGTSVIGCDAEAGREGRLEPHQTPDARPGAAVILLAFRLDALAAAVVNRVGQCLLTCPTTAVFDGLPQTQPTPDIEARLDLGNKLMVFGDGYQERGRTGDRACWHIPVMDGRFAVEQTIGAVRGIGGGNLIFLGAEQAASLGAACRAVGAIAGMPGVMTPFPGGVVRSGSKVGSRYEHMVASTNHLYCPTLRDRVKSALPDRVGCVYEVVIDGLSRRRVASAMRAGVLAACGAQTSDGLPGEVENHSPTGEPSGNAVAAESAGLIAITAGNYGGKLGKIRLPLHEMMSQTDG